MNMKPVTTSSSASRPSSFTALSLAGLLLTLAATTSPALGTVVYSGGNPSAISGTEIVSDSSEDDGAEWVVVLATKTTQLNLGYDGTAGHLTFRTPSVDINFSNNNFSFLVLNSSLTITEGAKVGVRRIQSANNISGSTLTISNGGQLTIKERLQISSGSSSLSLNIDGGSLIMNGTIFTLNPGSSLHFGSDGGTVSILSSEGTVISDFTTFLTGGSTSVGSVVLTSVNFDDYVTTSSTNIGGAAYTTYSFAASAVPEPATYAALAGGALLAFALVRRRRTRETASHS